MMMMMLSIIKLGAKIGLFVRLAPKRNERDHSLDWFGVTRDGKKIDLKKTHLKIDVKIVVFSSFCLIVVVLLLLMRLQLFIFFLAIYFFSFSGATANHLSRFWNFALFVAACCLLMASCYFVFIRCFCFCSLVWANRTKQTEDQTGVV